MFPRPRGTEAGSIVSASDTLTSVTCTSDAVRSDEFSMGIVRPIVPSSQTDDAMPGMGISKDALPPPLSSADLLFGVHASVLGVPGLSAVAPVGSTRTRPAIIPSRTTRRALESHIMIEDLVFTMAYPPFAAA